MRTAFYKDFPERGEVFKGLVLSRGAGLVGKGPCVQKGQVPWVARGSSCPQADPAWPGWEAPASVAK